GPTAGRRTALVVVPGNPDGGPRDLADALAAAGFAVTLVAPGPQAARAESSAGAVREVRVPGGAPSPEARKSKRTPAPIGDELEGALGREIDRAAPDALVVIGAAAVATAAHACARAVRAGRPMTWVYVEATVPVGAEPAAGAARTAPGRREKRFLRYATRVFPAGLDPAQVAHAVTELAGGSGSPAAEVAGGTDVPARAPVEGTVLGIGPANMAGQGWAWAKAVERELPECRTEVLMVDRGSPLLFPADDLVTTAVYGRDVQWQRDFRDRILSTWTHALFEAGRPIMGVLNGPTFAADAAVMRRAGIAVGLVFHGSELRDPRRHAAGHAWSPFLDAGDEWVQRVQATVDMLRPDLDAFDGPCLVSTPDLLDYLPRATWLPVVVDTAIWSPRELPAHPLPVVLHTPSRAAIKGTSFVDEAVEPLAAEGLVDYRRVEGVAPERMPEVIAEADIVLDQFAIGSYGVLACQAMAAGRTVLGHVTPAVRAHVAEATGHELPIIEADPSTLASVLRELVVDSQRRAEAALTGPLFVAAVHDGSRSARVIADVLGIPGAAGR
ncbi:MAG: hypothetical protein QOF57_14, partial [Frankiaceae bacterium]|nr:hypothetical protein [Frankiaceae bacterium]